MNITPAPTPPPTSTHALTAARALARHLHTGQVDRAGVPYVHHLAAVADAVDAHALGAHSNVLGQVAWLHDVLEDTSATAQTLATFGIQPQVVRAVRRLTRPTGSGAPTYQEWIAGLTRDHDSPEDYVILLRQGPPRLPVVPLVKIADLGHNLRTDRGVDIPESLRARYLGALEVLRAHVDGVGGAEVVDTILGRVNPDLLAA